MDAAYVWGCAIPYLPPVQPPPTSSVMSCLTSTNCCPVALKARSCRDRYSRSSFTRWALNGGGRRWGEGGEKVGRRCIEGPVLQGEVLALQLNTLGPGWMGGGEGAEGSHSAVFQRRR